MEGLVFDVDSFAVHDGPGIRMAVYLKGCPLSCAWCHSPESQRAKPEVAFVSGRCRACGRCVPACPQGVHAVHSGTHTLDRTRCEACGHCVDACPHGALSLKGRWVAAEQVVRKAERMLPFFRHSGGGITLTGGEVSQQADFAAEVLDGCRAHGIHTAIETCGACSWERLEPLVARSDLVLYDVKLVDEGAHRRWVGASNRGILQNLRRLDPARTQVRIPLVPGITDTQQNLGAAFELMRTAGLISVALLPYNPSAGAKYEWLGQTYPLKCEPQTTETLAGFVQMALDAGLNPALG